MSRYLLVVPITAVAIYAVTHSGGAESLHRGPDFDVWTTQTHIPPNDDPYDILNVQSREEAPIILKRVLMNDDPKCVNMQASLTYQADQPVKLGEVQRFALGIHGFNACEPVKVLIETDRGEATYWLERAFRPS